MLINSIRTVSFGWFLVLSIYHFLVFLGRRKDYLNLIFSIYCLSVINSCFSAYLHLNNPDHIYYVYFAVSNYLTSGVITIIVYFIFKLKKTKIKYFILFSYLFLGLLAAVLILFSYITKFKSLIYYFFPAVGIYSLIFYLLLFVKYFLKRKIAERRETILILGFSIIVVWYVIYTVLLFFKIKISHVHVYFVFFINSLFIAIALTDSFNDEYKKLIDLKNTLEQKVVERTREIEEAHNQKTDFFINLTHETKTPLTLITNYLDKDIKNRGESNEIKIVKQNIDKLKNDMINFLDMEKLETGRIIYNHNQQTNLSLILNEKILLFKELAWKKLIVIESQINADIHAYIDPSAFDRIINNLLDNAVKYTEYKGKINVELKSSKDNIILKVYNTGTGISEEQKRHIFEPFYQISHPKKNTQGIGMGLYIVKKIIEEINGSIQIESEVNNYTLFKISLKRKKDNNIQKNTNVKYRVKEPVNNISQNKLKEEIYIKERFNILLVEDNMNMLTYLQENLYEEYNVFTARNGKKALDKLKTIPKPDLIISDVMMDELDGYNFHDELMKEIKYQSVPFIFLTAKSADSDKAAGLQRGAIDYIRKPFLMDELLYKIRSIINLQRNYKKNNIENITQKFSRIIKDDMGDNYNIIDLNLICHNYKINSKEKEIIKLLIEGHEYKEIGSVLNISRTAVGKRVHNIYKKMNIHNKVELFNILKFK